MEKKIEALTNAVIDLAKGMDSIKKEYSTLATSVDNGFKSVDKRFTDFGATQPFKKKDDELTDKDLVDDFSSRAMNMLGIKTGDNNNG